MIWFLVVLAPFLFVVALGAPYVRTLKRQRANLGKTFELERGSLIIDLGAGDGSVVLDLAAQGYKAIGVELNPILWFVGWLRCLGNKNAQMVLGNYWNYSFPPETKGVFIFSAGRFMERLDQKMQELPKKSQLVSFAFEIPGKKPVKTIEGLHLYKY